MPPGTSTVSLPRFCRRSTSITWMASSCTSKMKCEFCPICSTRRSRETGRTSITTRLPMLPSRRKGLPAWRTPSFTTSAR
jgi:hypothetical protein